MNEFQMITEVFYNIPEANLYASTSKDADSKRLCGIQMYKIMPEFAHLEVRVMISRTKHTFPLYSYYSTDPNDHFSNASLTSGSTRSSPLDAGECGGCSCPISRTASF
uniref:Putative secreted protein n=1 Tax=Ixodes ricinus TaxID=34613 RepID=A0A0K8R6M8_IXORI